MTKPNTPLQKAIDEAIKAIDEAIDEAPEEYNWEEDPLNWYNLYKDKNIIGVCERNAILRILFGPQAATDIINNKPLNPDDFAPEARHFVEQHNYLCETKLCPPY